MGEGGAPTPSTLRLLPLPLGECFRQAYEDIFYAAKVRARVVGKQQQEACHAAVGGKG